MAKKNNTKNVSVGKPKAGGAVYLAPGETTLPSDALSELPEVFACLGCISEDGVSNTQESDSEDGGIEVRHGGRNDNEGVMVVDTILKGNRINRVVIPRAKLSEVGDINRKRDEVIGYESTIKALSDDNGFCVYEYIDEAKKTAGE